MPRRYGELEGRQLAAEVGGASLPNAASDDMEAVIAGLNTSVAHAIGAVQAGLDRCMSFTGARCMTPFCCFGVTSAGQKKKKTFL